MAGNDSGTRMDECIYEVAVQNISTNISSLFADVALLQTFKPLIIPCYILVLAVGVFGNYLLLYVICRTRKMHNVTNFFIGNLAFSDMLMCATCVPFTLAYAFNPRGWALGRSMCYAVFLIQPVTVYVSVFTLTAIAVDRWVRYAALKLDLTLRCGSAASGDNGPHVDFKYQENLQLISSQM